MSQKQALLVDDARVTVHFAKGHQLRGGPEQCTESPCFELKELAAELRSNNTGGLVADGTRGMTRG